MCTVKEQTSWKSFLFIVSFLLLATASKAQVAYNFAAQPDIIPASTTPPTLTMDCLAANGYGQWTSSSATGKSHLLSNKLTTSSAFSTIGQSYDQAGILSSSSFTFNSGDSYPSSDAIKVAANLNGNTRYVWINSSSRNLFYVEGFNSGASGIDISFSSLPNSAIIVPSTTSTNTYSLGVGATLVTVADEPNPLDRFDVAIDGSYLYIVWEQATGSPAVYSIWATVINLSSGAVAVAPTLVTTLSGPGSTGRRPTVAVDIRNSGSVAPFDVCYIDQVPGGNVYWRQWNPSSSSFNPVIPIPNNFGSSNTWTNPRHARILVASQAGVIPSTMNQRGVYVIADFSGLNLFLDRIINGIPNPVNDYCDGHLNCARSANSPVENCTSAPPNTFDVLDDPLWALTDPYEGLNSSSATSSFTEFHCLYRLNRTTAGFVILNQPLMIIPGSNAGNGFCVSGNGSNAFFPDPSTNSNGVAQYCAAVNQMGIHVHWINTGGTAPTHYYRRDNREIDQDIEENTLLTDECDIGNTRSGVGILSPTLRSNKRLTLYSDPTYQDSYYTGSSNLVFDNGSTLFIGSSAQTAADFVMTGVYRFNAGLASSNSWTIKFFGDNFWHYYGLHIPTNGSAVPHPFGGVGHLVLSGSGETMVPTAIGGDYATFPSGSHPVSVDIYPGTYLELGKTDYSIDPHGTYYLLDIVATDAVFNLHYGYPVNPNVTQTQTGTQMALNDNATFTKCQFLGSNAIGIGGHGFWTPGTPGSGTFDANYDAAYGSAANTIVTFTSCYFKLQGPSSGFSWLTLDPGSVNYAPSALTVNKGYFDGWEINSNSSFVSPWWPIKITDVTFDNFGGLGISPPSGAIALFENNPPANLGSISRNYSIYIDHNDFIGITTNTLYTDALFITDAPDVTTSGTPGTDALREAVTVTHNKFESSGAGSTECAEAAIHFQDATGDIGYNTISGSKYARGIWTESSQGGSSDHTWSLICSNTISGLTGHHNPSIPSTIEASGLMTDYYVGYAKLNSISSCIVGHLGGSYDGGHIVSSSYTNNSSFGFEGTSNSAVDMAGVHHPSDPSIDVAAYNVLTGNNSGGTQISLSGIADIYLGLEPAGAWPSNSPYGLNNIQGSPDICGWSSQNLLDVSNNYWGGNSYYLCSGTSASGGYNSTDPGPSGFVCSDGLIAHKIYELPQSITDLSDSSCGKLFALGYGLVGEGPASEPAGYDTLRYFLEQCPYWNVGGHGGENAWTAFGYIGGAVSEWTAGGPGRWPDFLVWLKKVLYLNPDSLWYCNDVGDMITALQENQSQKLAVCKYILGHHLCSDFEFDVLYNSSSRWKHQYWLDSLKKYYQIHNDYGNIFGHWQDSIRVDTIVHPYDSTYGTIDDYGLSILRGPQYGAVGPSAPVTSSALGAVRVQANPFDGELVVMITMSKEALVTTELRDLLGRAVPLERSRYRLLQMGDNTESFSTSNLPSGTYYLRVSTDGGEVKTVKVVKQ